MEKLLFVSDMNASDPMEDVKPPTLQHNFEQDTTETKVDFFFIKMWKF